MESTWGALLVLLLVVQHGVSARKLPNGLTPCSRNEPDMNACALSNGRLAIPTIIRGVPSYRLPSFDPLLLSELRIDDPGSGRQVALNIVMQDLSILGFRNTDLHDVNIDLPRNEVSWSGSVPQLQLIGRYNASGRVLILPLQGHGDMNITLENLDFIYKFRMERGRLGKDNQEYIGIRDNQLDFEVKKRVIIDLKNLFNGDQALSDNMNLFLNENWREMVKELGPPIAQAFNVAVTHIMSNIARVVPFDEIFPDTPVAS